MELMDTHCHLDMDAYSDDLDEVLAHAASYGVDRIITIGIDVDSSRKAIELAEKYDGIYATVGIHPHNSARIKDEDYSVLRELVKSSVVVGYGEIGMDLHYDFSPEDIQQKHFITVFQIPDLYILTAFNPPRRQQIIIRGKGQSPYRTGVTGKGVHRRGVDNIPDHDQASAVSCGQQASIQRKSIAHDKCRMS